MRTLMTSSIEPEIKEYFDFLNKNTQSSPNIVPKSRIDKNLDKIGNAINTFLTYPDILADIMTPEDSSFSMFFMQRMVLREMARTRQSFFTFTRGFSKSFLAFYSRYVTTMLVPRHKAFVTAGTKEQAAQIAKEKIEGDLWVRFPLLMNEMQKVKKAGQWKAAFVQGNGYAEFRFTHGGIFDVVGGTIRGFRRNSGIFEEVIQLDATYINEQVIPLLNKPREDIRGNVNLKEPNSSKIFVTTAGYQGTYAYDKLIETLCYTVIDPDNYGFMGGSYQIPVMHGLLEEKTIQEIISAPSFTRESFEREYMSIWSGATKGAAFSAATITALRKIVRAEYKAREDDNESFYAVSADMAKDGTAATVVEIFKVTPKEYMFNYKLVNLFRIDSTDYEVISNILKRTVLVYEARLLIYDANGIGAAIRDWLNKRSITHDGIPLDGLGIINPPTNAEKDVIKYPKDKTICYEIKATGQKAEQIHNLFFSRISNGSIRFLIKSQEAIAKFAGLEGFKRASNPTRERKLRPYRFMDEMELELRNIEIADIQDNINKTMKIKRRDSNIQKDFFSAAEYAIYGVNQYIELEYYKKRRRRGKNAKSWVFVD